MSLPKCFVQNRDGEYAEKYYLINTYVKFAVNPEKIILNLFIQNTSLSSWVSELNCFSAGEVGESESKTYFRGDKITRVGYKFPSPLNGVRFILLLLLFL